VAARPPAHHPKVLRFQGQTSGWGGGFLLESCASCDRNCVVNGVGCCTALPTQHHQRLLSPSPLSLRHAQEHHPADEVRGSARFGHPEQSQVEHLTLPHHPARGAQHIPGGPARHHREQGEDPDFHASHQGHVATGTGVQKEYTTDVEDKAEQ
jgi:hypothetical protein